MARRGRKPGNRVSIRWNGNFAYAIGLLATDGNLSPNGRHISFTSKDKEQIHNLQNALRIDVRIGKKGRGGEVEKKYYVLQWSDVSFYRFLVGIGISPAKSKSLYKVGVPEEYFFDFLRGCFDGDGYSHSYWDKRWKSSFLLYVCFCSASFNHILWLQEKIHAAIGIKGHTNLARRSGCYQLRYAKAESKVLAERFYKGGKVISLSRKRLKIKASLGIMGRQDKGKPKVLTKSCADGETGRRTTLRW